MIHLIIGNTGSGKTTYAWKLASRKAGVVFSIDEWNSILFFPDQTEEDGLDWIIERIERSESIIWNLCLQLNEQGVDAILDLGFARFDHREKFRKLADDASIPIQLHYLEVPKDARRKRLEIRNAQIGESYDVLVTEDVFHFMESWFELPTPDELRDAVIIS